MRSVSVLVLMERYDHRIRQGIGRYAAEHDWFLTLFDGSFGDRTNLLPQGWSGNGILTQVGQQDKTLRYVRRQRVPCVDMWLARPDLQLPRVSADQLQIGRIAADHLLERGFRNAIYFSAGNDNLSTLRYQGFADRFADRSGTRPQKFVWALHSEGQADDWRSQRAWLKRAIQALPKPMGIFCFSDYEAAKAEVLCLESGYSIPDEIAILGVDNDPIVCENIHVPLTSIRNDLFRVGYESAALLDRLMHGERASKNPVLIPPSGIEIRASTDAFVSTDPTVRAVIKFFQKNLNRDIGVEDAAKAVNLPSYKLKALFGAVVGQSVYATLLRLRFFEVGRLLTQTRLSIKQIAARTGFCHAQHLNNIFQRMAHCTPTHYRAQYARANGRAAISPEDDESLA